MGGLRSLARDAGIQAGKRGIVAAHHFEFRKLAFKLIQLIIPRHPDVLTPLGLVKVVKREAAGAHGLGWLGHRKCGDVAVQGDIRER